MGGNALPIIKKIFKWLSLSILMGVLGGIMGAGFYFSLSFVTALRTDNGWLICLLPVASSIIIFICKKLKISNLSTNSVIKAANGEGRLSSALPLGVFSATIISHLLGASVGREGAALQMGSGTAHFLADKFKLSGQERKILMRTGMAAVFAAVFGTPITAFLFTLEVAYIGKIHFKSVLPCFLSSVMGFFISSFFGTHPERFNLKYNLDFNIFTALEILILTVLISLLSMVFCYLICSGKKFAKNLIKNEYLRITVGGLIILVLTILCGHQDYNGAGVNIIENIFNNNFNPYSISFRPEAFLLKLVFTTICVSAGFKGGEIIPTLFIGATFGALVAGFLSIPMTLGAALGMVLLFCGATNCPLASIALAFELFSGVGFWYFVPTVILCFLISGKISLYPDQKHIFKYL